MILQEWTIVDQRRCPKKIPAVNRGKKSILLPKIVLEFLLKWFKRKIPIKPIFQEMDVKIWS